MKLALLKNRQPHVIAVDISANAVKLLELSLANKQYCVKSHIIHALPAGSIAEGLIQNQDLTAQTVCQALKMAGTKSRWAAVALPNHCVVEKVIKLNKDPAQTVALQLQQEMQRYVPYGIHEMAMDFQLLNDEEALVVATHLEMVEKIKTTLKMANLSVALVDVKTFAISNAALFVAAEQGFSSQMPIACVHLENDLLYFMVLEHEKLVYSFQKKWLMQENPLEQAMSLLEQYEAMIPGVFIEILILSGDCRSEVSINVNRKVHRAAPFQSVLGEMATSMMICCGLALHGLKNAHLY